MNLFTAIDYLRKHNQKIGLVNNQLVVVNATTFFSTCKRDTKGHCMAGEGAETPSDKQKYVGAVVGTTEIHHSAANEEMVARNLGGKVLGDFEPKDIEMSKGRHSLEVKTLMKGEKQSISAHPDALVRKIDDVAATGTQYHTVVIDDRETFGGGAYSENYSGHRLYYKRGCDRLSLSNMHQCKSMAEIKRLINTPDDQLPEKAKGTLPEDTPELRAKASKASDARKAKDTERKERLKAEGKSAYERQTV